MKFAKKIILSVVAITMLVSMSTSVFADGITPFAEDTTSNLASATNSHTRWVGPGDYCHAYGYISDKAPSSGAQFTVEHSKQGVMIKKRIYAGDDFSETSQSSSTTGNWRGIIQWGTITISV